MSSQGRILHDTIQPKPETTVCEIRSRSAPIKVIVNVTLASRETTGGGERFKYFLTIPKCAIEALF